MKPGALLLTPGASADRNHSTLRAIEAAVAPMPVARIDFPTRPAIAIQRIRDEAAVLLEANGKKPKSLALGGRSFGGRMCSMAVAEGLPASALVLISYPLHPPGKPDNLRIDHFPSLEVPCLFVSGTRDAFARPDELELHAKKIPGPVTHVWIEGGAHGFKKDDEVATAVAAWLKKVR
ncbi:MAG TPA: alpha/beta family hydrolase [Acidimicrobiales bacterium]|nr:alpha/beta family hydrolase [Acidimicrobiales bacterium]